MFCSRCGAQIPEGSKFCEKCGTSIDQPIEASNKKEPKKGLLKIIILSVVGIIIVLTGGFFAYRYYETEIVPEKVEKAVGSLNVVGYDLPISAAMDRFFDVKSANFYEYKVEKSDGQYYVTISGDVYDAHYDFHFWYDDELSYVTISDVEADGEKLSETTREEYDAFLDEVFGTSTVQAVESYVPDVEEETDISSDSISDDSDLETDDIIQEDNTVDESKYDACDDFEPELHDFITEDSDYEIELALTYTRVLCGRFDLYANYYDANGNLVNEHETGVFDEDLDGNGIIKFDGGGEGNYYVDYSSTPATLILYGNDGIEVHMVDVAW